MTTIALMIRLASRLGMLDYPSPRKVHAMPVARVGGVGVAIGALIPIALWAPGNEATQSYLIGSLVLLVFGMWDDARDLNPYLKFVGQIIAASAVVYYGNVYVAYLPFSEGNALPASIAQPFTVFALVGMINALNVSDGLDGLAGGITILSLSCVGYLALMVDGFAVIIVVVAALGGVLGFLRYNTFPARVFMGDVGSQFLGFTLGFLAVFFTQKVDPVLSPSLVVLILGLPIFDLIAVVGQRLYYGINPFVASKHHIHHRLLELGFDHYEAVVMIYLVQALFIASAVPLRFESDWLILSFYFGVIAVIYLLVFVALRSGWRAHQTHTVSWLTNTIKAVKRHKLFVMIPARFVSVSVPLLFIVVSVWAKHVPRDFSIVSAVLSFALLVFLLIGGAKDSIVVQMIIYVTAAFVAYLETKYIYVQPLSWVSMEFIYYAALAIALGLAVRYSGQMEFRTTPTDYLIIFVVLFVGVWLHNVPENAEIGSVGAKLFVLFYGCEFIISRARRRWYALNVSALMSLSILALRGLV